MSDPFRNKPNARATVEQDDLKAVNAFFRTLGHVSCDPSAIVDIGHSLLSLLESSLTDVDLESDLFDLIGNPEVAAELLKLRPSVQRHSSSIRAELTGSYGRERTKKTKQQSPEKFLPSSSLSGLQYSSPFGAKGRTRTDSATHSGAFRQRAPFLSGSVTSTTSATADSIQELSPDFPGSDNPFVAKPTYPAPKSSNIEFRSEELYKEIFVPPPQPCSAAQQRLKVAECLDPPLRRIFEHTEHFNPVQSTVFSAVYHTSENLLICAPTGAGKTNIALLAIGREILHRMHERAWRCVYIAPMRALASEIVRKLANSLRSLSVEVLEYTGDTNPTLPSLRRSQVLVTTPEKWDVLSRNSAHWQSGLAASIRLLVIDEIHLLHDNRGPVLEAVVARTLRLAEIQQTRVRIVGLSATLPNYVDISAFLRVTPEKGLFYFDASYRPVPLGQRLIGMRKRRDRGSESALIEVCYEKARSFVTCGHQVIIFVHSRKKTKLLAEDLLKMARERNEASLFVQSERRQDQLPRTIRSADLRMLLMHGVGIHHAGLARSDRIATETLFRDGSITLLVSTATLAWGVNLPARAVIIYGTKIYDASRGGFVDIGVLDILQIFGRAGRPEYDSYGEGIILTEEQRLPFFYRLLSVQMPIESQMLNGFALVDHLNAEIATGHVTSEHEALAWLACLYLSVRLAKNPLHYGIAWEDVQRDPTLSAFKYQLLKKSIDALVIAGLVSVDSELSQLEPTDWGIVASRFYVSHQTMQIFKENLRQDASASQVIRCISSSSEFENLALREEEIPELETLYADACPYEYPRHANIAIRSKLEDESEYFLNGYTGKVYILLQSYISRATVHDFALLSDMRYIEESATRLFGAVFEIALRQGWPELARNASELARAVERRLWPFEHPLTQMQIVQASVVDLIKNRNIPHDIQILRRLSNEQWTDLLGSPSHVQIMAEIVSEFPYLEVSGHLSALAEQLFRIQISCTPCWKWGSRLHSTRTSEAARYTLMINDVDAGVMVYSQSVTFSKKQVQERETSFFEIYLSHGGQWPQTFEAVFLSEEWLGADQKYVLQTDAPGPPQSQLIRTPLLNLRLLGREALGFGLGAACDTLFPGLSHLNPIQTQICHSVLHSDASLFIGMPPNAGKDLVLLLCILRQLRAKRSAHCRVLYLSLASNNMDDMDACLRRWLSVLDVRLLDLSDGCKAGIHDPMVVCCVTPKQLLDWLLDKTESAIAFFDSVDLVLVDNMHHLNEDNGVLAESALVAVRAVTRRSTRLVAFGNLIGNAMDLASWLSTSRMYNFALEHSPTPIAFSVIPFRERNIAERFARMDQTIRKIVQHHNAEQVIVLVQSDRECIETARRLLHVAAADGTSHRAGIEGHLLDVSVLNADIGQFLAFGIGVLVGEMNNVLQSLMQDLFSARKLSWLAVAFPLLDELRCSAPVVVVKGTEWHLTAGGTWKHLSPSVLLKILQRCGCQEIQRGSFYLLASESRKAYFQKLLECEVPVEAGIRTEEDLGLFLCQMVAGDLVSEPEESFQLTRETYLSRRLAQNPSWYPWVTANDNEMRTVVETSLLRMASIGLLRIQASSSAVLTLEPTTLGKLACFFSLRPIFFERINNLLSEMNQEKREQKAHDLAHEDHACMPDSCKVEDSIPDAAKESDNGPATQVIPYNVVRFETAARELLYIGLREIAPHCSSMELAVAAAVVAAEKGFDPAVSPLLRFAKVERKEHRRSSHARPTPRIALNVSSVERVQLNWIQVSLCFRKIELEGINRTQPERIYASALPASCPVTKLVCFAFSAVTEELLGYGISEETVLHVDLELRRHIPAGGKLKLKLFCFPVELTHEIGVSLSDEQMSASSSTRKQ